MRVGDQIAVQIEGHNVCLATVEQIEDNQAYIVIPATRVVFQLTTKLSVPAPEKEHIIIGTHDSSAVDE